MAAKGDAAAFGVLEAWSRPSTDVVATLRVVPTEGLSAEEAARRLKVVGPNRIREASRRPWWSVFAAQFVDMVVWLLAGGAVLSFVFGEADEGWAIVAVLLINAMIGFVTELRAARSMEALRSLAKTSVTVRRAGRAQVVDSDQLVPGDVLLLGAGDVVPADARLIDVARFLVDESMLTGESVAVAKSSTPDPPTAGVSDRRSMVFKGTFVTRGDAEAVVVASGDRTEIGRIAELVATSHGSTTPLEKRLAVLGRRLAWLSLGIAAGLGVVGYGAGHDTFLMIETAISLAVATVPEGLPLVATIALARGVWRMARRRALIRRLSAVETLGSTSLILTDKTGTLTANRMAVVRLVLAGEDIEFESHDDGTAKYTSSRHGEVEPTYGPLREALIVAVLCNDDVDRVGSGPVGDPLEWALLEAGARAGMAREVLLEENPEQRHEPFDAKVRMMATVHGTADGYRVAVKGAPEAVLAVCTRFRDGERLEDLDETARRKWIERNDHNADEGFRMLAVATKTTSDPARDPYCDLTLLGLVALIDPPRRGVREAVQVCRRAGLRVVMLTGDHPGTAFNIASAVGLLDIDGDPTDLRRNVTVGSDVDALTEGRHGAEARLLAARVIARASPEQKLTVLRMHQQAGRVVAMLGDGVNDAPTLRSADIGVAMGQRGTQVARETADMVLEDDNLGTIASAIEQGRIIFRNIRKFARYLLSCNASEVLVIAVAMVAAGQLPLLPLQILFLNLVTDVFPALALAACEGGEDVMSSPPRPSHEPILCREHWLGVGTDALLMSAVVLLGWWFWGGDDPGQATTTAFFILAGAQLGHVLNMTEAGGHPLNNEVSRNPWVWGAITLCVALLVLAASVPFFADALDLVELAPRQWVFISVAAVVPLMIGRLRALVGYQGPLRRRPPPSDPPGGHRG